MPCRSMMLCTLHAPPLSRFIMQCREPASCFRRQLRLPAGFWLTAEEIKKLHRSLRFRCSAISFGSLFFIQLSGNISSGIDEAAVYKTDKEDDEESAEAGKIEHIQLRCNADSENEGYKEIDHCDKLEDDCSKALIFYQSFDVKFHCGCR